MTDGATPRIDAHATWFPGDAGDGAVYHAASVETLLSLMEAEGIDRTVLSPAVSRAASYHQFRAATAALGEIVATHRDRFLGSLTVAPAYADRVFADLANDGVRQTYSSLRISPDRDRFALDDADAVGPVLTHAAALGWPVVVESSFRPPNQPLRLLPLARAWPDVTFVLTHLGYRLSTDAIQTALLCPNVMLETSENWDDIIGTAVRRVSAARVMCGSNFPFSAPGFERLKVSASPWLSAAEKDQVLGGTAARVFGLSV